MPRQQNVQLQVSRRGRLIYKNIYSDNVLTDPAGICQRSWEGDSLTVLRSWPKSVRQLFGGDLEAMQEGRTALLPVRPMPSIAPGVFELKASDASKWYRLLYLARVGHMIYVLHCFTKSSVKTDRRDLAVAEKRWKEVQQKMRQERKDGKKKQR